MISWEAELCKSIALSMTECLDSAEQYAAHVQPKLYVKLANEWVEFISPSSDYVVMCRRSLAHTSNVVPEKCGYRLIAADAAMTKKLLPLLSFAEGQNLKIKMELRKNYGLNIATLETPRVIQLFDERRKLGLQLTCDEGRLPPWEPGSVLKTFVHWIALQKNMFMFHSGSLTDGSNGILLAGKGGSGKSGTVLAGLCAGLQSCGDDHVLVSFEKTISAISVYGILKQDQKGFERCHINPQFWPNEKRNWQNKIEVRPDQIGLQPIAAQCQIKAIVLPTIGAPTNNSRFEKIEFSEIANGLMPANLKEGPDNLAQSILCTLRIYKTLPIYRLHLGTDAKMIGHTIKEFLQGQ